MRSLTTTTTTTTTSVRVRTRQHSDNNHNHVITVIMKSNNSNSDDSNHSNNRVRGSDRRTSTTTTTTTGNTSTNTLFEQFCKTCCTTTAVCIVVASVGFNMSYSNHSNSDHSNTAHTKNNSKRSGNDDGYFNSYAYAADTTIDDSETKITITDEYNRVLEEQHTNEDDENDHINELSADALVVDEVWQLVSDSFLPVRNDISVGFDREAWNALRQEGVVKDPPQSRQAAYDYIRGMLSTLNDPFTRFVTPNDFKELLKYDISGVGLNIAEMPENTNEVGVLGLVAESSGAKAGMKQGDVILSVDDFEVKGMSAFQVSSLIQGEGNTTVNVKVRRDTEKGEDIKTFKLKRASGAKNPVKQRMEGKTTGYIRLTEFNALAEKDVAEAVKVLRSQGAREFILDLRDNPGGLVQAGVEIGKLFLPQDATIAYTEGRVVAGGVKEETDVNATENVRLGLSNNNANGAPTKLKRIGENNNKKNDDNSNNSSSKPNTKITEPLVVLVNSRSASASEILTGSLKDNCRATVVGSKTYGKGLIQSVYELSDGSGVVLTVGRYVTPKFVDIDRTGITPDFAMFPGFEVAKKSLDACELPQKR